MTTRLVRPYLADPCYPPVGRPVQRGWGLLAESVPANVAVLAVDGPVVAAWGEMVERLGQAFAQRGREVEFRSTESWFLPWERVQQATASYELRDDPDFDYLASGRLEDLLAHRRAPEVSAGALMVLFGPGAALVPHDVLWYADLPKRYAEAAVAATGGLNLGQPPGTGPGTTKRLFYIDWPLLDRHRDEVAGRAKFWLDMQVPEAPGVIDADSLWATVAHLSGQPFRTRPTFNTTPWGGHWGQAQLGHNPLSLNTALGYELIAPEAGVLVGAPAGPCVEVPFQLIVAAHPLEMLGGGVHQQFGTSFPVRFDYLDTVGGGNLSVHCHPQPEYMRRVFGWPYTQHESYYMMVGGEDAKVFLGLGGDADVDAFEREARRADEDGTPLDVERYVSSFPASAHQLFLIPSGTPHGSGAGNVVLEVSATPYLYSLRFYDWLRRGPEGSSRPVHVDHAFANLDRHRRGDAVRRELLQKPAVERRGEGWHEELIGALQEMFFEVRRLRVCPGATAADATGDRFHVLNVVAGKGILLRTVGGAEHSLVYAETIVVPAAVGAYHLRALGDDDVMVVKALVR